MSDLARGVKRQSGAMRDAYPDQQAMVVLTNHNNNTYDVQRPGWGGSRKLTRITNVNPDIVGQISVDDTVLVGYYNGNPQQAAILSKAGFLLSKDIVNGTPFILDLYRKGLPLTGVLWGQRQAGERRLGSTGDTEHFWRIPGIASNHPIAINEIVGPPRVFGNRVILWVAGEETDESVMAKLVGDPILPNRVGEVDTATASLPYRLRVAHMNISQGPPNENDGASEHAGNGNPTDFIRNLHLYDIEMQDMVGINRGPGETPYHLVSDMILTPFVQRVVQLIDDPEDATYDYYLNMVEERVWVTTLWFAPSEQGQIVGRKWSRSPDYPPGFLQSGDGRFYVSRTLLNVRRSYSSTEDPEPLSIRTAHPLIRHQFTGTPGESTSTLTDIYVLDYNGWQIPTNDMQSSEISDDVLGKITIIDKPSAFTDWVTELPYAPMACIYRGEDSIFTLIEEVTDDLLYVVSCRSEEADATFGVYAIIELYCHILNASTGEILSTTQLEGIEEPIPPWDSFEGQVPFWNDRPYEDVGVVPWFSTIHSDHYRAAFGMIYKCGYLNSFIFHRNASNDIFAIPQMSQSAQLLAWKFPAGGGTPTLAWSFTGWGSWPALYTIYTVCGIYDVANDPEAPEWRLLVHFEEFGQGTATNVLAFHNDWLGMQWFEEAFGVSIPFPGDDGFFHIEEWPRPGYTHAYEVDNYNASQLGGPTTDEELEDIFNWGVTYWTGRNNDPPDEGTGLNGGVSNHDTDQIPTSHKHGFMLVNPETGSIVTTEYIKIDPETSTIGCMTGPLICEWFKSIRVLSEEDPCQLDDTYGHVVRDFRFGDEPIPNQIASFFGCVPPLDPAEYQEVFNKSFSVRYPKAYDDPEEPDGYYPPEFSYARASTSYTTGGSYGVEGWVLDTQGRRWQVSDEPIPEPYSVGQYGKHEGIYYARRFYVVRHKVAMTAFPYEQSIGIPFSPTRMVSLGDVAVFLNKQSTSRYGV